MQTPWASAPLSSGWWLGDPAKVKAVQLEIKQNLDDGETEEESCFVEDRPGEEVGEGEGRWVC